MYNSLDYWSRDILNFDILEKSLGIVFLPHFMYDFFNKNFSCYVLLWTKFHFLNAFTSWDIGQYVYCSYLFHKFRNQSYLSNQTVFINDQKVKTKTLISWEREKLWRWNKKHLSPFLKGFQLPKIVSDLRVLLAAFGKSLR